MAAAPHPAIARGASAGPVAELSPAAQLQDLLQGSSHTVPVWLNPERFLQPDFDAEEVVLDLRRYVPLATLHNELQDYLGLLKAKLVEVINEDYGDYVSLSSRLVNVDGSVMRMRKPLVELKDKLSVVQDAVKAELTALNQGLKRRKEVATARSLLELLQELSHVASKVEKLLAEVDASKRGGVADLDAHGRLLERVAGEVSRLTFQSNRGKDLAFVRAMEPRTAAYRSELEQHIGWTLEAALQQRHTSAALHCLHAYVELGEAAAAERAVRRVVVAPAVAGLVAQHKQQQQQHARAAPGEALSSLLSAVLPALEPSCGALLRASLAPQGALRIFDFPGNSILDEVQSALAAELPAIFSPGVPPAFHANYLAALRFLSDLEACCHGHSALERFRSSTAYVTFLKRWNLSVYFSLLYQEIAGELEDSLRMAQLEVLDPAAAAAGPGEAALGLSLPPSAALVRCLQRAAAPQLFLLPLADRFLRLALQLVQRYLAWMEEALAARRQGGGGEGPAGAAAGMGAGAAGAGAGAGAVPPMWVAQLPVEDLGLMHQDLTATASFLTASFSPSLDRLLAEVPEPARASAAASLAAAATSLRGAAAAFLDVMAAELGERCLAVVKQLKGITATYRMTTKGPPTRHSHYVTGVLAPLRGALEAARGRGLSADAAAGLTAAVAELVNGRYLGLAEELLRSVRKTEESLKRLKKAAVDGAGDGISDSDKIGLQLYLDVQEYGNQLSQFGLVPSQMQSYERLLESVTPASQLAATRAGQA